MTSRNLAAFARGQERWDNSIPPGYFSRRNVVTCGECDGTGSGPGEVVEYADGSSAIEFDVCPACKGKKEEVFYDGPTNFRRIAP